MYYGELSFFTDLYNRAIIDSGTSLLVIPREDFTWMLEAILAVDEQLKVDKETGVIFYETECQIVQQVQYGLWAQFDSNYAFEVPVEALWTSDLVQDKSFCALNAMTSE